MFIFVITSKGTYVVFLKYCFSVNINKTTPIQNLGQIQSEYSLRKLRCPRIELIQKDNLSAPSNVCFSTQNNMFYFLLHGLPRLKDSTTALKWNPGVPSKGTTQERMGEPLQVKASLVYRKIPSQKQQASSSASRGVHTRARRPEFNPGPTRQRIIDS